MATSAVIAAMRENEIVTRVVYDKLPQRSLRRDLDSSSSSSGSSSSTKSGSSPVFNSSATEPQMPYCATPDFVGSSKR